MRKSPCPSHLAKINFIVTPCCKERSDGSASNTEAHNLEEQVAKAKIPFSIG